MNIADELQKLADLRASGDLSEAEFAAAKMRLLTADSAPEAPQFMQETIGRAANRYVSLQMVMAGIGLVIFLVMLFAVILPQMRSAQDMMNGVQERMPHFEKIELK